jgi:hypothetical protein
MAHEATLLVDRGVPVKGFWGKTVAYFATLCLAVLIAVSIRAAQSSVLHDNVHDSLTDNDNPSLVYLDTLGRAKEALGTCNDVSHRLAPRVYLLGVERCGTRGLYDDMVKHLRALRPMHDTHKKSQKELRYFDTRGTFVSVDEPRAAKPVEFSVWLETHADTCDAVAGELAAVRKGWRGGENRLQFATLKMFTVCNPLPPYPSPRCPYFPEMDAKGTDFKQHLSDTRHKAIDGSQVGLLHSLPGVRLFTWNHTGCHQAVIS